MTSNENQIIEKVTTDDYKYGFYTDIEMDYAPKGLSEDIIRFISAKRTSLNGYSNGV